MPGLINIVKNFLDYHHSEWDENVIDSYVVRTCLKDIYISEADRALLAHMDSHVNEATKGERYQPKNENLRVR